jgi:ankyrin repeat protein
LPKEPFFAVAAGRLSLCKALLTLGAAVDLADDEGLTPLHFAVQWGREDIVRLLLYAGVNVDATDIHGNTALWYSMSCGSSQETFLDLIAAGASVHTRNRFGETVNEAVTKSPNRRWRAAVGKADMSPIDGAFGTSGL